MDGQQPKNRLMCPGDDLAAYLDGELDKSKEASVEQHLNECSECRAEVNFQKVLLNQLDKEFADSNGIELPEDFSVRIVAVAESRVSGLRSIGELRSAALILVAFGILAAIFLTSFNLRGELPAISVVEKILGASSLVLHLVYDLSIAMAAFTKALQRIWAISSFYAVIIFAFVLFSAFIVKKIMQKDL